MLKILNVCISLFVSILVTNVWLFRFNKETPYRGGNAKNMIEEFATYGLDLNTMYLVGSLKIIASLGLIIASKEIVNGLFGYGSFTIEDVEMTSKALMFFGYGVIAFALVKILANFFIDIYEMFDCKIVCT